MSTRNYHPIPTYPLQSWPPIHTSYTPAAMQAPSPELTLHVASPRLCPKITDNVRPPARQTPTAAARTHAGAEYPRSSTGRPEATPTWEVMVWEEGRQKVSWRMTKALLTFVFHPYGLHPISPLIPV